MSEKKKRPRGRPRLESARRALLSIRVLPELAAELDQYAAERGQTRSEAARDLLDWALKRRKPPLE